MAILPKLATVGFVVALPVLIVTSNIRFLTGEVRFYERGFREYDAAETTGIPLPELDRAAQEIIDYFENDATTLHIVVRDDEGHEELLFNERETQHMEDVKGLMRLMFRVNEIALAFVLAYIGCVVLWARERSLRVLARDSLIGIGVGLIAVGAIAVFAATGFDAAWTRFHELAFRNDFWELNPATDHLIQMFPEPFWEQSVLLVGVMSAIEALAIAALALVYLVFSRRQRRIPEGVAVSGARRPEERIAG